MHLCNDKNYAYYTNIQTLNIDITYIYIYINIYVFFNKSYKSLKTI